MEPGDSRSSILLVSPSENFNTHLTTLLQGSAYGPVTIIPDATRARRSILEHGYDIVMINAPLPDEFGTRFALDICDNSACGVMLLVKAEHYPEISARVSPCGVLTLSKPTSGQVIMQTLQLLSATRVRLRRMEQKTASVEKKMEEIRIVNRAKWLLIDQLKMTEQQAHRYIEKQAMDRCVTRRAIAENILTIYNDGGIQA